MELLEVIVEHLTEGVLGSVGLALAALVVFVAIRTINRDKLVIERFTSDDSSLAKEFASFSRIVESEIRAVVNRHLAHQEAAGDLNVFTELAPQSRADEIALEIAPTKFHPVLKLALWGFGWLTRPPVVRGFIYHDSDRTTLRATVYQRGRAPYELEKVSRPTSIHSLKDEMARELGLKVIIRQSPSISVSAWQALDHLTRAIEHWRKNAIQTSELGLQQEFEAIRAALLTAQQYDPHSPLVNYNLALLYYYRYNAEDNEKARTLFEQAAWTDNIRLKGLAKKGVARSYCQDYHRFGRESRANLDNARRSAAEAVDLMEQAKRQAKGHYANHLKIDMARALYCRAFAQHVTERPEDIEKGKNDYLQVIEETKPNVPAFVYNNLGYILMAKAGRFVAGGNRSDYEEARRYLQKAVEREPGYKFALANLGNIERLLGNYKEAIRYYREALERIDPGYANGWNELAWVYLENGQPEEAAVAHQRALNLARDDGHRSEVKELYAHALHSARRHEEALKVAREAQALNPNNTTLNEWLVEIEEVPSGPPPS